MPKDPPQAAVIVRTKNEEKAIQRCLDGIYGQQHVGFEVVVVDSGSTDRTLDLVGNYPCRLVSIEPEEFTYGRALNEGVRASSAPICVALSAHAYPFDRMWLKNLTEPFEDEQVAGVVGKTVPLPGANPFDRRGLKRRYHTTPVFVKDDDDLGYSNANAAWRRSVWNEIPFDETLPYSEDVLWARVVRAAGYKVAYRPDACVYHSHDESPRELVHRFYNEAHARCLIGAGPERFSVGRLMLDAVVGTAWDWFHLLFVNALRDREGVRKQFRSLLYAPVRRAGINYGRYRGSRDAGYPDAVGHWGHPGRNAGVAILTDYYPPLVPGGAEVSVQRLATALAGRGEGVIVLTPAHGQNPGCIDEDGVLVCRMKLSRKLKGRIHPPRVMGNPLFYWRYARKAGRILKTFRPEVLHSQNVFSTPPSIRLSRKMKLPCLVTVRDYRYICPMAFCLHDADEVPENCGARAFRGCLKDYEAAYNIRPAGLAARIRRRMARRIEWWDSRLRRLSLIVADGTVFVGRNLARICLRAGAVGKSHRVIYNLPPDAADAHSAGNDEQMLKGLGLTADKYILFVGRFSRGKGAQTVVDASNMLEDLPKDFVIAIAGSVEWPVDDANGGRLLLLGRLPGDKLDLLYRNCRAVILPSVWQEPLSRVLLESAQQGKAVIASDTGGNPEVLRDGRTGLLVPRSDARALAQAIVKLATDRDLALLMGKAAKAYVSDKFDPERSLDDMLEYYGLLKARYARP